MENIYTTFDSAHQVNFLEREKMFFLNILKIEDRHITYFKARPTRYQGQEHERLEHHFVYYHGGTAANLRWLDESNLEETIKKEVETAFMRVFDLMVLPEFFSSAVSY